MRRPWLVGFLILALSGWLGALPPTLAERPAGELRIGVLLSLSGHHRGLGQAMKAAVGSSVITNGTAMGR